jgi:hypothetical protein
MQVVDMEVDNVELRGAAANLLQHDHVMRDWVKRLFEPQGSRTAWYEVR